MEMFSQASTSVMCLMSTVLTRVIGFVVQEVLGSGVSHSLRSPLRHPVEPHQSQTLQYFATLDSRLPSDLEPISASALEQRARPDHQEKERAYEGIQQNP